VYCLNYWWNSPQVDHQLPKQFGVKTYYSNSNNISGLWTTFGPGPKTKHCCRSEAHSCCHLLEVGLSDKPAEICSDTRSGTRFHNPLPLSDVQTQTGEAGSDPLLVPGLVPTGRGGHQRPSETFRSATGCRSSASGSQATLLKLTVPSN
jgi:hypothetical protein